MSTEQSTPTLGMNAMVSLSKRWKVVLVLGTLWGVLISPTFTAVPAPYVVMRTIIVSFAALGAFTVMERWPPQLPRWIARWVLQVAAVAVAIPLAVVSMYWVITRMDSLPMFENPNRIFGIGMIAISGMLVAPWVAMAALMRSRDDAVRSQAMNFAQERSALERQNQFARLRLLQAQVQPHFLFNTLANVRELVESKSDKAPAVLNSLIAYLRAAVPKLNETTTSVAQELALVRAYLEVMHMRIPDRLAFTVEATDESLDLICPPMMLMTLVENAVRHGIDQSTSGGTVAVRVCVQSDTCLAQVTDSGVGLGKTRNGLGTGLSTLRQRLKLMFGDDAELSMAAVDPLGTKATVRFPATRDGE